MGALWCWKPASSSRRPSSTPVPNDVRYVTGNMWTLQTAQTCLKRARGSDHPTLRLAKLPTLLCQVQRHPPRTTRPQVWTQNITTDCPRYETVGGKLHHARTGLWSNCLEPQALHTLRNCPIQLHTDSRIVHNCMELLSSCTLLLPVHPLQNPEQPFVSRVKPLAWAHYAVPAAALDCFRGTRMSIVQTNATNT